MTFNPCAALWRAPGPPADVPPPNLPGGVWSSWSPLLEPPACPGPRWRAESFSSSSQELLIGVDPRLQRPQEIPGGHEHTASIQRLCF